MAESSGPGRLPRSGAHIATLDGVRGVAILLVLAYHQTLIFDDQAVSWFDAWFARTTGVGWCGVDLFFVLSGFLITGILLDAKEGRHYFRNFYARRTLRIFPLYYAVVFVSLVVLPHLPSSILPPAKLANFGRIEGDEIWYWLYLSNYSIAVAKHFRHSILDISWSLAIEEQFYLLWPTVVLLLGRTALRRLCVALMGTALALRAALALSGADWHVIYVITPARMDVLAAGALVALAAREPGGLASWRRGARRTLVLCAAALLSLFAVRQGLSTKDPLVLTLGFSLLAVGFASLLVLVLCAPPEASLARGFSSRFLRAFGKYSYAIYLFHLPIRGFVRDAFYGRPQFGVRLGSEVPGQVVFYLLATALAFGAAWLSWNLYEKQFLKLKRFFPAVERPEAARIARSGTAP